MNQMKSILVTGGSGIINNLDVLVYVGDFENISYVETYSLQKNSLVKMLHKRHTRDEMGCYG
jgi:hypothetical protein